MTRQPAVWSRPVVWAFCAFVYPHGDQVWVAVTESGLIIAEHVSSNESWGAHDVGPERKRQAYIDAFGCADVDYRVLPVGQRPAAPSRAINEHAEAE